MDTAYSEDNVSKDILLEEPDPLVSNLQSSDLPSESKGVKVEVIYLLCLKYSSLINFWVKRVLIG